MTELTAEKIWEAADKAKADRVEAMPTEQDALNALQKAYQRLRDLGWRDAIYCPKDRKIFDAIEAGSTGIFKCHYEGEWPKGSWWIHDANDLWPSRPILFRELKN